MKKIVSFIMEIVTVSFEEPLIITVNKQVVRVVTFETAEHGNIKFGVDAPRAIGVHREEIYQSFQNKKNKKLF